MQRIYLLIPFLTLVFYNVHAQQTCYDFENCVIDASSPATLSATRDHGFNAFGHGNAGCLSVWEVASGTPSLWRETDGLGPAYDGTQFAMMGVCGDFFPTQYSDAIVLKHPFDPGNTYTVSMAVRTNDVTAFTSIQFVLLKDSLGYTYNSNTGCSPTPAIPVTGMLVDSLVHLADTAWQTFSFTVANLNTSYNRLWIRPLIEQGVTAVLCIDAVCVSQPLPPSCFSFDDCVVDTTSPTTLSATRDHGFNAFGHGNAGCLSDWEVASGTPSLWRETDGLGPAYDGGQFAMMGVCGDFFPTQYSDAIVLKHPFNPGNTYTVSMAVRTNDSTAFTSIDFFLLKDSLGYTYNSNTGCSPTPAIPPSGLLVNNIAHLASPIWQVVSFTVNNLSTAYNRLWIRPLIEQNISAVLCIDSVCVSSSQPVGVSEPVATDDFSIVVYPNPATNELNIHAGRFSIEQLNIYDLGGRLVMDFKHPSENRVDISSLDNGVYVAVVTVGGNISRIRWVKM